MDGLLVRTQRKIEKLRDGARAVVEAAAMPGESVPPRHQRAVRVDLGPPLRVRPLQIRQADGRRGPVAAARGLEDG
jgi:hypothetical protein